MRRPKKCLRLIVATSVSLLFLLYAANDLKRFDVSNKLFQNSKLSFLESSPPILSYKMIDEAIKPTANGTKLILFWTDLWHYPDWHFPLEIFDIPNPYCKDKNCIFTRNRNYSEGVHEYDAIIFHSIQPIKVDEPLELPKTRKPQQLYIMARHE